MANDKSKNTKQEQEQQQDDIEQVTQHVEQKEAEQGGTTAGYDHSRESDNPQGTPLTPTKKKS